MGALHNDQGSPSVGWTRTEANRSPDVNRSHVETKQRGRRWTKGDAPLSASRVPNPENKENTPPTRLASHSAKPLSGDSPSAAKPQRMGKATLGSGSAHLDELKRLIKTSTPAVAMSIIAARAEVSLLQAFELLNNVDGTEIDKVIKELHASHPELALPLAKMGIGNEVDKTSDPATLFRGTNATTKLISTTLAKCFRESMQETFGDKPDIRSAPLVTTTRDPGQPEGQLSVDVEGLMDATNKMLALSLTMLQQHPSADAKELLTHLHDEVGSKFPAEADKQVVGNFVLRYLNPALLINAKLSAEERKNMTVVTKLLQNMANNMKYEAGHKEAHLAVMNDYLAMLTPLREDMISLLKH